MTSNEVLPLPGNTERIETTSMNLLAYILMGLGCFYSIEGAANIYYWRNDKHPFVFQLGRALRTIFGLIVVLIAYMFL
jgi:hypothetical protein